MRFCIQVKDFEYVVNNLKHPYPSEVHPVLSTTIFVIQSENSLHPLNQAQFSTMVNAGR
jgi:hypothetical protein